MRERDDRWDDDPDPDDWDAAEPASSYGVASRAVTQGFVGTRGATGGADFLGSAGYSEHTCPLGCRDAPWPDCAGCGRPAVVALPDPDPTCPHSLSLCAACWGVLLSVRGPQRATGNAGVPKPRTNKRMHFTAEELARIVALREQEGALWTEIAGVLHATASACGTAYRRVKARALASGTAAPLPPMLDSTATTTPTPSVVPKTRRRPALTISVPTPTTKRGHARASATPNRNRTQSKRQTREPRPLSAEVEQPSLVDASERKYNMARQGRSTGRAAS